MQDNDRRIKAEGIYSKLRKGENNYINYIGYKYAGMEVIEQTNKRNKSRRCVWKVKCDCGKVHERTTNQLKLRLIPMECSKWKKKHKDFNDGLLKRRYGIGIDEYNKLYNKQEGFCAICGKHQTKMKKRIAIDHNHETGIIRGLLCVNCNLILGLCHDNIDILQKAIEYLKEED